MENSTYQQSYSPNQLHMQLKNALEIAKANGFAKADGEGFRATIELRKQLLHYTRTFVNKAGINLH